jgi:uncharacterized membrane protein
MNTRITLLIFVFLVLLSLGASLYASPRLAEPIAVHWNASGQADGYGSRFEALYLLPVITFVMTLLLFFMPVIDPLRANIQKFRSEYNLFLVVFVAFMVYLHFISVLFNLKVVTGFNQFLAPAFGLLIIYTGVLVSKARRNYIIGIRTPWTLSSDAVWDQTHRLGGKLFKVAGLLALLGVFFPEYAIWFLMVPVSGVGVFIMGYSYYIFRKLEAH